MAWPNKGALTAKEILGMESDELKTKLDSAATKDDLKAVKDGQEALTTSLSQIQAALAKLTAPPPPDPDPNIAADQNDPTTQVLTDPAGFVNRQTANIAATAAQARADVQEMRARQTYAGVFQKYGKDLAESANRFPVTQRAQDGFWDYHISTFVGQKALRGEIESGSYPSLMGSSSFAPNTQGEIDDPNKGFTADEASFYKTHNIPLDKAAKIKQMMHKDGEAISLENYKGPVGHA